MKITLNVPDDGRKIRVLAGRELVAFTDETEPGILFVKIQSCNLCGECCMDEPSTIYGVDDEGKCNMLVKFGDTWECGAGVQVPYSCIDDPTRIECCSIKYNKVRIG